MAEKYNLCVVIQREMKFFEYDDSLIKKTVSNLKEELAKAKIKNDADEQLTIRRAMVKAGLDHLSIVHVINKLDWAKRVYTGTETYS